MKIAILQLNPIVGDVMGNTYRNIAMFEKAYSLGARLIIGNELGLLGYPPKDLLWRPDLIRLQTQALHSMNKIVMSHKAAFIIGAALSQGHGEKLLNAAVMLGDPRMPSTFKTFLPDYDVFDETRYFQPRPLGPVRLHEFGGHLFPIGICEDLWGGNEVGAPNRYSGNLIQLIAEGKVQSPDLRYKPDFLVSLNASPYYWGKGQVRFNLISGIARRLGIPVIYANQVGGNDELIFDGHSFVVDAQGRCIGMARPFYEDLLIVDLDDPKLVEYPSDYGNLEDLRQALVLGLKDYVHKTGHTKVDVGLSGGVDSSVTACLAVDALGVENVLGVYMPSPFSSDESRRDAQAQAENLRIKFKVAPIGEAYAAFQHILEPIVGWNAPGTVPGQVTAENVQARVRGAILMGIANSTPGMMVLSTGNKSELAMGYCTLYGDMAGGLAVISDLPKTLVYKLAEHLNRNREIIPKNILIKAPSAELAPGQKDSDSLPEYDILDPILDLAIGQNMCAEEIISLGHNPKAVCTVLTGLKRAEHKRKQMPIGLKVTTKAFGSGRRMPIAAKFLV